MVWKDHVNVLDQPGSSAFWQRVRAWTAISPSSKQPTVLEFRLVGGFRARISLGAGFPYEHPSTIHVAGKRPNPKIFSSDVCGFAVGPYVPAPAIKGRAAHRRGSRSLERKNHVPISPPASPQTDRPARNPAARAEEAVPRRRRIQPHAPRFRGRFPAGNPPEHEGLPDPASRP